MHAFLIIGAKEEDRKKYIATCLDKEGVRSYDIKPLIEDEEAQSLGIKRVREWQKELLLMPRTSPFTAGVIFQAHLLTVEAQNALLKTLEEPPAHTRIYMEAPSERTFLPTILSRCQRVTLKTTINPMENHAQMREDLEKLTSKKTTPGQILHLLDSRIKNKEEAQEWVNNALYVLHESRQNFPNVTYSFFIKQLLQAIKRLSSNVSYKLVVDTIFLSTKH